MRNFIIGTIFGIVISTVGFSGVAAMGDKAVQKTKEVVQESAR